MRGGGGAYAAFLLLVMAAAAGAVAHEIGWAAAVGCAGGGWAVSVAGLWCMGYSAPQAAAAAAGVSAAVTVGVLRLGVGGSLVMAAGLTGALIVVALAVESMYPADDDGDDDESGGGGVS